MSDLAACLNSKEVDKLRRALLAWYKRNRRDLPWRRNNDPYRVWVSEIMLQQTRVAAVLDHYARFIRRFPTIQTLAAAREASVLAAWSGLGYYHRARRLHKATKVIVRGQRGRFPATAEEWKELPGIGRYTAAAIASIAFGEHAAVVDGNVERVLTRISGREEGRHPVWEWAQTLLDPKRPGDFNQAMMELGAIICTPKRPQCKLCPLKAWCKSRGADAMRRQAPRKHRQVCYALVHKGHAILLVQRPANASLMACMWELPTVLDGKCIGNEPLTRLRHTITDTDYEVSVIALSPDALQWSEACTRWFSPRQWKRMPLTGLTRKVLRELRVASLLSARESKGR